MLLLFILVLSAAMFAVTGFGLLVAVFGLITDQMHFILNLLSYVLMIFCGANFPIAQLPGWARILSHALPLTHSIEAANMLFGPIRESEFYRLLIKECGLGIIYFICAFIIIKAVEKSAIKKASLEVF